MPTTRDTAPTSATEPRRSPFARDYLAAGDVVSRLRVIQVALARDAALLAFMSKHPEHYDTLKDGRAVSRHVRTLKTLAELELRDLRSGAQPGPGPASPVMKEVLSLLVDKIVQVAHDVLPAATANELDDRFRNALETDSNVPWP